MLKDVLPPILDATCASKMMWFNKDHPDVLYMDKRCLQDIELCDGRLFNVQPDVIADFTKIPFPDNSFYLVIFDPPHLIHAGDDSYMAIKYGKLDEDWKSTLYFGVQECMRVLRPGGTLIFKWNEYQIPIQDVLDAIKIQPLFGHRSGKASKTHWMVFFKAPVLN